MEAISEATEAILHRFRLAIILSLDMAFFH